jgi:PAS domain S-box-containing protein
MEPDQLHLALLEADFEHLLEDRSRGATQGEGRTKSADIPEAEQKLHDRARERRFRNLLNALPAAVYTTDAVGRITFYNEAAVQLWGCRPELGKSEWCGSWRLFWPDGTPMPHETCPMAIALKEKRAVRGAEGIAEHPDGTRVPFIPYPTPLLDVSGALVGAVNMLIDITERKRAEEQQALLIRELHHRVKNMLATVQAIMGSTARATTTIEEFQEAFTGRIASLAQTHSSLAEDQWQAISFQALLCNELDPYEDGNKRVRLNGPAVDLPSDLALPLGMALHELTTNAAKHGSLSVVGGSIEVKWSLVGENDCRQLQFEWIERDGPTVEQPRRRGFGSQLLERVLTSQIGARVSVNFAAEGLHGTFVVPLPANSGRFVPMDSLKKA